VTSSHVVKNLDQRANGDGPMIAVASREADPARRSSGSDRHNNEISSGYGHHARGKRDGYTSSDHPLKHLVVIAPEHDVRLKPQRGHVMLYGAA
jgi:hypothetical protein